MAGSPSPASPGTPRESLRGHGTFLGRGASPEQRGREEDAHRTSLASLTDLGELTFLFLAALRGASAAPSTGSELLEQCRFILTANFLVKGKLWMGVVESDDAMARQIVGRCMLANVAMD
ncbi:MAG TPA: hypothetical protein VKK19_06825 [Candidatus Dormibacteraeota bacterium]|nr:hypothetical protein [Candidatus Dormibacteraeota bacterium]